jgi:uncharacterized protein with FMN-binding domain
MTPTRTRALAIGSAGFALLALAGCATTGTTEAASTSAPQATSTEGSDSTYSDGTYTAKGSYIAPSGTESVTVEITIANDIVTAVTTSTESADHEATEFLERFASGISTEVVGTDISALSVTRVAGSSLTSAGFNSAVEDIRSQAA